MLYLPVRLRCTRLKCLRRTVGSAIFSRNCLAAVSYIGLVDQFPCCQIGYDLRCNFIRTDVDIPGLHPSVYPIGLLQVAILFLMWPNATWYSMPLLRDLCVYGNIAVHCLQMLLFFVKTLHLHEWERMDFWQVVGKSTDDGFWECGRFQDRGKPEVNGAETGRRWSIIGLKYNSQSWGESIKVSNHKIAQVSTRLICDSLM